MKFLENFKTGYVKEQLYFHAVRPLKEMDGLLKELMRGALSREIHKICKFKTFELLLRCPIWSSDTKKHQKLYYHYSHLKCLTNPFF